MRSSTDRGALPLAAAAILAILAVGALLISTLGETFSLSFGEGPAIGLELDPLSAALLVVISGLGLVVQSFVARYSVDDPRLARLRWLLLAATFGSAIVASAATLLVLAAGWVCTSLALAGLLAHRPDARAPDRLLGRGLLGLALADLCLIAAVAVATATTGNVPLSELGSAAGELGRSSVAGIAAGELVAILIVIAALGRCAQIPFRAWITQTIAVPTPVSALLHAGIVNAGGLLIIFTAPLVTGSESAMLLLYAVAATTMLYGTSLMMARPDVKGALVLSTRGQMAFMLLQVSIGAFAAAIFHLIAHGMYKATLFLGAGGVIDESRTLVQAPTSGVPAATGARAVRQALPALLLPALLIAGAVAVVSPDLPRDSGGIVLLGFAWASAAQASWWWLRLREPSARGRLVAVAALAGAVFIYVALLGGAKELLAPDLPAVGEGALPAVLLAPVLALAVGATALRWISAALPATSESRRSGPTVGLARLQRRAYVRALSAGAGLAPSWGGLPRSPRLARLPAQPSGPSPSLGGGE